MKPPKCKHVNNSAVELSKKCEYEKKSIGTLKFERVMIIYNETAKLWTHKHITAFIITAGAGDISNNNMDTYLTRGPWPVLNTLSWSLYSTNTLWKTSQMWIHPNQTSLADFSYFNRLAAFYSNLPRCYTFFWNSTVFFFSKFKHLCKSPSTFFSLKYDRLWKCHRG